MSTVHASLAHELMPDRRAVRYSSAASGEVVERRQPEYREGAEVALNATGIFAASRCPVRSLSRRGAAVGHHVIGASGVVHGAR